MQSYHEKHVRHRDEPDRGRHEVPSVRLVASHIALICPSTVGVLEVAVVGATRYTRDARSDG